MLLIYTQLDKQHLTVCCLSNWSSESVSTCNKAKMFLVCWFKAVKPSMIWKNQTAVTHWTEMYDEAVSKYKSEILRAVSSSKEWTLKSFYLKVRKRNAQINPSHLMRSKTPQASHSIFHVKLRAWIRLGKRNDKWMISLTYLDQVTEGSLNSQRNHPQPCT